MLTSFNITITSSRGCNTKVQVIGVIIIGVSLLGNKQEFKEQEGYVFNSSGTLSIVYYCKVVLYDP